MGIGTGSLKFANVWRVIREVDLEAIRREALGPFDLAIVGEHALAEAMRAALSPGGAASPHRFIRVNPGPPVVPTAVIVVARSGPRPAEIDAALSQLAGSRVPHTLAVVEDAASLPAAAAAAAAALVPQLGDGDRLAFAHQLPVCRAPLYEQVIEAAARANASYAFTTGLAETVPILTLPLSLGDMVVLTKTQLMMGYRLVLASGRDGEPRALIGEILGVLGGGLLFRQMARQLVGLIPIVGIIPKVAIAYGGTWAVGRAVVLWVNEGRPATSEAIKGFSREGLERGRAAAKEIVSRGRAGAARASDRFTRLRAYVPGLRPRRPAAAAQPPPLPPQLPPPLQS